MKTLYLYLSDEYLGELTADAGYYRLTKSEADSEYARMKAQLGC